VRVAFVGATCRGQLMVRLLFYVNGQWAPLGMGVTLAGVQVGTGQRALPRPGAQHS
jgi:hypothetical protein